MLSGNCTEALSVHANVTISGCSAKLIKNDIAPLPFPLPALLKQYWYIKRGERVRVRGHARFDATLGLIVVQPTVMCVAAGASFASGTAHEIAKQVAHV